MKSITEVMEKQEYFWNSSVEVFFAIVVPVLILSLIAFAVVFVVILENQRNKETYTRKDKLIMVSFILISTILTTVAVFTLNSTSDRGYELRVQESELIYEFYQSIEKTETVETNDIINSFTVNDSFCSHVKLKENENCTFVEFVSETPVSKVFIPLESERFSNSALPISITYKSFTKEERDFANKLHNFSQYIRLQQYEIKDTNWSFGVSIDK